MNFDEWFADWVKAAPEWNDAAGNYETIAAEAWEYQEQQLAELREVSQGILDNVPLPDYYRKHLKRALPEEGK